MPGSPPPSPLNPGGCTEPTLLPSSAPTSCHGRTDVYHAEVVTVSLSVLTLT